MADEFSDNPNSGAAEANLESGQEHAKEAAKDFKTAATAKVGELREAATAKAEELRSAATAKVEELRGTATAKAEELRTAATAKAEEFRTAATAKAEELRGKAEHAWGDAKVKARTYQDDGEAYVRENPTRAILTAVGVGFILGLIFRK
jgi:ElaB/YqjD/DUF883 family membrane-anchored ribosome-binding protein